MEHPSLWRETCDPFGLAFGRFQLLEILGYPHAGNDVFHVRGIWHGQERIAYIKVPRGASAGIEKELGLMTQYQSPLLPRILDWSDHHPAFLVTEALPGQRLSVLVGDNDHMESLAYLETYGRALSEIHCWQPDAGIVPDRKFHHPPSPEKLAKLKLSELESFFCNKPKNGKTVFCHGDFHYANILWQGKDITGILDFEYCGYGERDFDIAWALFVRPGQRFLKTRQEQEKFLEGYSHNGTYDLSAVRYYMAQIYVHFLGFCGEDQEYCRFVRTWLSSGM